MPPQTAQCCGGCQHTVRRHVNAASAHNATGNANGAQTWKRCLLPAARSALLWRLSAMPVPLPQLRLKMSKRIIVVLQKSTLCPLAAAGSAPLWRLSAHDAPACSLSFCAAAPSLLATASTDKKVQDCPLRCAASVRVVMSVEWPRSVLQPRGQNEDAALTSAALRKSLSD